MAQPTKGDPSLTSPREYFDLYRNQIEHEDSLVGSRITFLIGSQSALLAIYLLAKDKLNTDIIMAFFRLTISVVSIYMACISRQGILAAAESLDDLKEDCKEVREKWRNSRDPGDDFPLPPVAGGGREKRHYVGLTVPTQFPFIFAGLWVLLLAWAIADIARLSK